MTRHILSAKIHRVRVTEANLAYEGSLTLDAALLEAAGLVPYERVEVYNVDNGHRFATYVIQGRRGSGTCCVNGAAAHLAAPGNRLIVCAYALVEAARLADHRPRIVLVDARNGVREVKEAEAAREAC